MSMAQAVQQVFKRTEKKYMLDASGFEKVTDMILPHVEEDIYGRYTICNIYFDTQDDELIRNSIEKPKYKEKFRLRSYGIPSEEDMVFLEIKKKYKGVVYKRRIPARYSEAKKFLEAVNDGDDIQQGEEAGFSTQIMHEIEYIIRHYNLYPKVYIAYDRIAFSGVEEQDLRITFDNNIRTRVQELSLSARDYGDSLLDNDKYLMEIKTNGAMPIWLARGLSELKIFPNSFSKYGNDYKRRHGGTEYDTVNT